MTVIVSANLHAHIILKEFYVIQHIAANSNEQLGKKYI